MDMEMDMNMRWDMFRKAMATLTKPRSKEAQTCCERSSESIDGTIVCTECGRADYEIVNDFGQLPYDDQKVRRTVHYSHYLERLQGYEATHIPDVVFETVDKELRRMRITEPSLDNIKFILKKCKFARLAPNARKILNHYVKIEPLPTWLSEELVKMMNRFDSVYSEGGNCFHYAFFTYMAMHYLGYRGVYYKICEADGSYEDRQKLALHRKKFIDIMKCLGIEPVYDEKNPFRKILSVRK